MILTLVSLLLTNTGCSTAKSEKSAAAPSKTTETTAPVENTVPTEAIAPTTESIEEAIYETEPAPFAYEHDPRLNPSAMADIIENPNAIYGFSPNPDSSRLGTFADYDWTDATVVEEGRQAGADCLPRKSIQYV